jgi:hypothetical protein
MATGFFRVRNTECGVGSIALAAPSQCIAVRLASPIAAPKVSWLRHRLRLLPRGCAALFAEKFYFSEVHANVIRGYAAVFVVNEEAAKPRKYCF